MDILREIPGQGHKVVGKRCDRCRSEVRAFRSMDQEFAMYEYVRVQINAGYGADYFLDGDSWMADYCERCAHEMFSPHLRLVQSSEERELQSALLRDDVDYPIEWLDQLRLAVARRRPRSSLH